MTATPTATPQDTGDDHDDHEPDDHSAPPRRRRYRTPSEWAGLVIDIVCAGA